GSRCSLMNGQRDRSAGGRLLRLHPPPFQRPIATSRAELRQPPVPFSGEERFGWHQENTDRTSSSRKTLRAYATRPSGFSQSSLNTFISSAPSVPFIARWSKLPVALITVAIWSESSIT